VPPGARFCPSCGARLVEQPVLPTTNDTQPGGELRQITVMFCDIVGSTRLSTELHPEDLRELIRAYHVICAAEIEGRGGMIASYMGDGVMAYFGYPQASEDAAMRAADAALGITRRIAQMGDRLLAERGLPLATRVALHTGRVLVGEIGAGVHRDRHAVTGVVPNLAARLESLAPRNGVVVSEQTRALIERAFRVDSLGSYDLKGIPQPVEVHRVLSRKPPASVLRDPQALLIEREAELEAMEAAWRQATGGARLRVTVVAEPGVGKSALAARFIERTRIEPARVIEFAGSIGERNAPFACLRQTISRHLEAAGVATVENAREVLTGWLGAEPAENAAHVETLLALWQDDLAPGPDARGAVFAAAAALLAAVCPPMLVVLEDAHWIDPSTRELLERILLVDDDQAAAGGGRLTLVLTRPGGWRDEPAPGALTLRLGRLGAEGCRRLVEALAGCRVEVLLARRIEAATDGLPLYVEEFTKSLMESGLVHRQRGVLRGAELGSTIETPASLLDLITSRLDMLGDAKVLAQIAAVLGRNFDREALLEVSGRTAAEVDAGVATLEEAGILVAGSGGAVGFRHALFQKAAYESLLRSALRTWHRRYLDWLAAVPERLAAVRPETRGFHLDACGEHRAAAEQYLEAGMAANRASASFEAAAHFQRACELLAHDAASDSVAVRLQAQVLLAGALLSARGPGAPETRAAYDEALRLAETTPESDYHLAAYWGWWRVSENFSVMAERARRLLEVSQRMRGAEFKLQAMHCAWANAFQMGELETVRGRAQVGLQLYEEAGFAHLRTLYGGHDCKVCALGETGLASWLLGAGDAAVVHADQALAHAEAIEHLGSLLHALDIAVMLHHYRRDALAVAQHAERLRHLATVNDLEEYRAKADIFFGWCEVDAGRLASGLERIDRGFRVMQEVGTPEDFPVYQCMRAEALRRLGRLDEALAALAGARAVIAEQGVAYWAAEIARQEALVALGRDVPDAELVTAKLDEAQWIAAGQRALALELRAAFARLAFARGTGNAASAAAELERVLARFAPDAAGRDLDEARAALAEAAVG